MQYYLIYNTYGNFITYVLVYFYNFDAQTCHLYPCGLRAPTNSKSLVQADRQTDRRVRAEIDTKAQCRQFHIYVC